MSDEEIDIPKGTTQLPPVEDITAVIEDAAFKAYLQTLLPKYDSNGDGKLSSKEVVNIESLTFGQTIEKTEIKADEDIPETLVSEYALQSLKGIEYFSGLKELFISGLDVTSADLSHNLVLEILFVFKTNLTSLDLSTNKALTELTVWGNGKLTNLVVGDKPQLNWFSSYLNKFESLDFDKCPKLEIAEIYVDVRTTPAAQLRSLDFSKCPNLSYLAVDYASNLTSLNLTNCSKLEELYLTNNENLNTVSDLAHNPNLKNLTLYNTPAFGEYLDLSKNITLTTLRVEYHPMITLDISKSIYIECLTLINNPSFAYMFVHVDFEIEGKLLQTPLLLTRVP